MIERKYSKTKANANRVVWTGREIIPVVFNLDGLVGDGLEFGIFRVPGADMYCTGFRIDFNVPAGDSEITCAVGLYTADGDLVPEGSLNLDGVVLGATKLFTTPLPMPGRSVWKLRLTIDSPVNGEDYFPQGVNATYYLRYARGPVNTRLFSSSQPELGVGFDMVGRTMVVQ